MGIISVVILQRQIITGHRSLKDVVIAQSLSLKETPLPVAANVQEAVNL